MNRIRLPAYQGNVVRFPLEERICDTRPPPNDPATVTILSVRRFTEVYGTERAPYGQIVALLKNAQLDHV